MYTDVFKKNLLNCIKELGIGEDVNIKFIIVPVVENGKQLNSTDDYMRLTIFNKKNLENRYFDLEKVLGILSGPNSTYPLWINVEVIKNNNEESIIELQASQRFRKPSLLKNQETSHPPFKAIVKQ